MESNSTGVRFSSRYGLILAALGMAIGTGNIWRFPRILSEYGGGTFLLPLFLAHVRGYSAAEVGNVMLMSGLVMFVSTPLLGRIVRAIERLASTPKSATVSGGPSSRRITRCPARASS